MNRMTTYKDSPLRVIDWGTVAYAEAFGRQRALNAQVAAGEAGPTLVLVEHPPVITLTPRARKQDHLLASAAQLEARGITVETTDRGGDITYHGPGQLVAYPILRLNDFGLNLGRYMRLLEDVVIATADAFGITAHTEQGATGVWVGGGARDQGPGIREQGRDAKSDPWSLAPEPCTAKLCALGVRIRKNTTMHGLALNVTTDLAHFETIVPCGLQGRAVTSLSQLLGDRCPSMKAVKAELAQQFRKALHTRGAAVR